MNQHRIRARQEISNDMLRMNGVYNCRDGAEIIGNLVKHELSHQIASAIEDLMAVRVSPDWKEDKFIVEGEIWVAESDHRTCFV